MGGGPVQPIPAAQFGFATPTPVAGEIHTKPGRDFRFVQYQGFTDYIAAGKYYEYITSLGADVSIEWPSIGWNSYDNWEKFVP
jgi:hypothetical protein